MRPINPTELIISKLRRQHRLLLWVEGFSSDAGGERGASATSRQAPNGAILKNIQGRPHGSASTSLLYCLGIGDHATTDATTTVND